MTTDLFGDQPKRVSLYVKARVARRASLDGLICVPPDIAVGHECVVDLATKQDQLFMHTEKLVPHVKCIVQDAFDGLWWPWDCLDLGAKGE